MFRSIPYHDPPVCTHCGYYIRVLRLVSGLVHFSFVIYFLHDVELDFHLWIFLVSAAITTDLFPFFIIIGCVRRSRLGELYCSYLEVVGSFVGCVSAE